MFASPDILLTIKSKAMGWSGRVARMGEENTDVRLWRGKLKEVGNLEICLESSILLKCILNE